MEDTGLNGAAPATEAEPLVRGRFAVYETPDGGWAIAHADGICESCTNCGCGEQGEALPVPAMVAQLVRDRMAGRPLSIGGLRKMASKALGGLGG